jgi:hypothetical protein
MSELPSSALFPSMFAVASGALLLGLVALLQEAWGNTREARRKRSLARLRLPLDYERHALEYGSALPSVYFSYVSNMGETRERARRAFQDLV